MSLLARDIARLKLAHLPTPLEPMDRLAAAIGKPSGTLYVKRDDCTGFAAGGNKVRKLEFVIADALAQGCDHLVTVGGGQSNAARAIAGAAARTGLGVTLVLDALEPERLTGNLLLDSLYGAELVWAGDDPRTEAEVVDETCDRLRTDGRTPYHVHLGASTPLGALGYAEAAQEILDALPDVDLVVTASGSAGTQAGLVARLGDHERVLGVRAGARRRLPTDVDEIARGCAELAGLPAPSGSVRLDEDHLGAGYAVPTDDGLDAIVLAARTEGLLLDPVYTGKAMSGLIDACRDGTIGRDEKVVFIHTGGLPGLLSDEHGPWVSRRLSRQPAAHRAAAVADGA